MAIKLLLHIGYPKTATTTLQEEVFVKLHDTGKINYLGRTSRSTHTKSGFSKFNGIDLVSKIRRHFFLDKPLKFDKVIFSEDKLNVISDEDLTFHDFFHNTQFNKKINHHQFPKKIKKILGDDVEIKILLTLRNQTDLIYSCYLQKIRLVKIFKGNYSFSDFLKNNLNHFNRSQIKHLDLYNFNEITRIWEYVFKTKVNYLFFEDIKYNKDTFLIELSKYIPATQEELFDLIGNKHHRKKDKSKPYNIVHYRTLTRLGKFLSLFIGKRDLLRLLERRYYMRFSLYIKFERKLLIKHKSLKVPKPTISEQNFISLYFNESNKKFAIEKGIDFVKLRIYNYIN